jgi:ribonuclease G
VKEILIDRGITQSRLAVYEDGKMIDLYIENHGDTNITGNIYKARVENVVQGLNAVFVNIGTNKNAILHFDDLDNEQDIKRGKEILVQVIREPIKDKGARVSSKISVPGKYIVLLPNTDYRGISQKISDEATRKKMLDIAIRMHDKGFGFIIRTEALSTTEEELVNEYLYLKEMWTNIQQRIDYVRAPQIVFNARDFYTFILREYLKNDIVKIFVNRKEDEQYLGSVVNNLEPKQKNNIIYDEYNFSRVNALEQEIINLTENRISLPSGGYLIIDQAEAFTIIDVNTGSFIANENLEETVLKTNIEACNEIFRIIKLKNLSGIILIDFIDMEKSESKERIINIMKVCFKKDKVSNRIYDFTTLGILEMSRAKKGKRLSELIYINDALHIIDSSYCLKKIENTCVRLSKHYNKKEFSIIVSPYIMNDIKGVFQNFINEMKLIYNIKVAFTASNLVDSYYIEDGKEDPEVVKIELRDRVISGKVVKLEEDNNGNVRLEIKRV